MPSNNSKYTEEMRTQTAEFILNSGKSATSVAEEMGIDTNTVCRWVRDYRRKNKLGTYAEEKGYLTGKPTSGMRRKMSTVYCNVICTETKPLKIVCTSRHAFYLSLH